MLFKSLNRDEPERVFVPFENNEGQTIAANQTVQLDASTAADGVKAISMRSGSLYAFLGVADAAVSNGAFGLAQVYGYRSTGMVFQTNTSQDTGVALVPVAAQSYLQSVATTVASNTTITLQPIFAVLLESIASAGASATVSRKVWIRAL
jgi:hypothetical protein